MKSSPALDTAPTAAPRVASGMVCLDTSRNPRIPVLMQAVAGLSRAREPQDVLREFANGLSGLDGGQGYLSLSTRGLGPGEYKITRRMIGFTPDDFAQGDPWAQWDELPVHRGGFLGGLLRTAYPEIVHHLDIADDPVVGSDLARYRSMMALPLFDDGEPINWGIMLSLDPEGFSEEDLEDAILQANLVGTAVRNVLATRDLRAAHEELHLAHAALRLELDQIARIQRALLPAELPRIPGVALDVSYETFDRAGGDMYTLRPVVADQLEGPWMILVGDASGHGPSAAVLMAMMHAIIEAYPDEPSGAAEVLEHANRHLFAKRIEGSFITAILAIYDPRSRILNYARAGHPPAIVMHPGTDGWRFDQLDAVGDLPLGVLPDTRYEETLRRLEPGETIVLFTDGITEANGPGGAMFGVEGIVRSLSECSGEPPCAISHITSALREHQAGVRPFDDQTLMVIRVT